ncbi:MAG TPA: outer membrane beta-barrel protein, partial [Candidatus Binatia bacterium]
MKHKLAGILLGLGLIFLAVGVGRGAEEEKPLGPGWLSLDCCVGPLDKAIGDGKSAIEKALGIGISGFFDTSYTWSSNHPGAPGRDITGRYFHKDHNDVVFNDFNLTIDKPEKDWGVGFHFVGDFGRTGELLREATLWNKKLQKQPSAELREAFLTFTIPIGEGLQVKGGKFVTLLGAEILPTPGARNPNISDSFMF